MNLHYLKDKQPCLLAGLSGPSSQAPGGPALQSYNLCQRRAQGKCSSALPLATVLNPRPAGRIATYADAQDPLP